MDSRAKRQTAVWPHFDLSHSLKNSKSSKKVLLVDRFRNAATLEAVRFAALLYRGRFGADFSILDYVQTIPQHIQTDPYYLQDSRRQLQHHNQAPDWRYANPELKAIFYQLAMMQQAQQSNQTLTPFSLNLTPEFTTRAFRHQAGFIDYTKRQLDKAMLSELNRKPQYWFGVEMVPVSGGYTSGRQRPHLHGSILLATSERESVRNQQTAISAAFHKAVGKCSPEFSNRLFQSGNHKANAERKGTSELEAGINWPGYCLKHSAFARRYLNSKSNLIADNATKCQSEALYGHLSRKRQTPRKSEQFDFEAILATL
jgi:hypothetical protein